MTARGPLQPQRQTLRRRRYWKRVSLCAWPFLHQSSTQLYRRSLRLPLQGERLRLFALRMLAGTALKMRICCLLPAAA